MKMWELRIRISHGDRERDKGYCTKSVQEFSEKPLSWWSKP